MPIITRPDLPCAICKTAERAIASYCRDCHNATGRTVKAKWGRRYWRYGVTEEDIHTMWLFQGGRCDVCKDRIDEIKCHIDHDTSCCPQARNSKSCGKCVRALLCGTCNQGLGNFKDSIYSLEEAIKYLNRAAA